MKKILIFLGVLGLAFFLWKGRLWRAALLSPPEILGGPVHLNDQHGDRLYYLTSQWEKRISRIGGSRYSSNRKMTSWLHIDLWALDAATAQTGVPQALEEGQGQRRLCRDGTGARDPVGADSRAGRHPFG